MKTFRENEDIKASETNANNQELLSKINDNASQLDSYLKSQVTSLQSNINSVQSTLQGNINTVNTNLTNAVNGKLSGAISKSGNGYATFSNGLIIQWAGSGAVGYDTNVTCTFPKAFTSTNYKVIPTSFNSSGDDKINCHITSLKTTSITAYLARIESRSAGTRYLQFIAIGY